MMNGKGTALIGRPLSWWDGAWIVVFPTKLRPPLRFQSLLPGLRVLRANSEPGNAVIICDDKRQGWLKNTIWRGVDMTDQPAVLI